jgi:hypothetical protein
VAPFIRRIISLKALKKEGTDEQFFQGMDYARIPLSVEPALKKWCEDVGPANTSLPSKGATSDEPLDVYYLELGTPNWRLELNAMLKAVAPALVAAVTKTSSGVTEKEIFTSKSNAPLDELVAVAAFRNVLLRFKARSPKSKNGDPAIIISV